MTRLTIVPQGPFSLAEAVGFGFGQRHSIVFDGFMRLAFVVDGYTQQAGAVLSQDDEGVHVDVSGPAAPEAVRDQVSRILSLDVDASGYVAVGDRDPVVARLIAAAPGLRPPLFHSPYEAACWGVIAQRMGTRQASVVRDRLNAQHGTTFSLAGQDVSSFPTPEQLLAVTEVPGLAAVKLERLHGLARAALAGKLEAAVLRDLPSEEAQARLRQLPGVGPFYAGLIRLRATGVTDDLVAGEPRLGAIVRRLYQLDAEPDAAVFRQLAEPWRPFRTWVAVLARAAASLLPEPVTAG
jgi:DNA-3-methyladenine glycosylase II